MPELTKQEQLRLMTLGDKQDDSQDDLLSLLSARVEARFRLVLNRVQKTHGAELTKPEDAIPAELSWILDDVLVKRFNRIGSEGYSSESVEGHSVTFAADDFAEYEDLLNDYYTPDDEHGRGRFGRVVIY